MLFREFITESLPVFLLEYNREKTIENWGTKLEARIQDDDEFRGMSVSVYSVIDKLEGSDPTPNKQYVQWLIKAYINGSKLEDLKSRGKDNLEKFEVLKRKKLIKPEHADIGRLKDLTALENDMEQYELPKEENVDKGDVTVIEDNEEFRALIPHNETAACYYGQGTRWCTAAKNDNMFKRYHDDGDLIIIIPKKPEYDGEKYQIHDNPFVIMNEKDEKISENSIHKRFRSLNLDELFDKTPHSGSSFSTELSIRQGLVTPKKIVKNIPSEVYKKNMTPEKAADYAIRIRRGHTPELEDLIIKNARATLQYASDIIKGRWPKGEKTIQEGDSFSAFLYAKNVIKGRWPEGEKAISQDANISHFYARDIIKGRWPEGEKTILGDEQQAVKYARDVIKGRWPEAEKIISQNGNSAFNYATYVIKGPWPEAEKTIRRSRTRSLLYDKFLQSIRNK